MQHSISFKSLVQTGTVLLLMMNKFIQQVRLKNG